MQDPVALILLAAGGSSRMGRPKQLLPFNGRTLLAIAADHAIASPCRPIVVVLGAHREACEIELIGKDVSIVHNPDFSTGIGSSIRAGITHLLQISENVAGAVITLCDQPAVDAQAIDLLVHEFRRGRKNLIASLYSNSPGVPALFGRKYFPELQLIPLEKGAKSMLLAHPTDIATIDLPSASFDIDTPEDYSKLIK